MTRQKAGEARSGKRQQCSFEGCERLEHLFSGLCVAHHLQNAKGLELRPVGFYMAHRPRYAKPAPAEMCCVNDCEYAAKTRGYCEAHYYQIRHGGPIKTPRRQGEPMRRLLSELVARDRSACWTDWPFATHVTARGVRRPKIAFEGKSVRVAQLVVAIKEGRWAEHACHTCDVPACYNPDHLYGGDARTNADDRMSRGR